MISLNELTIKINDVKNFHGLLEVYEDLAAQKMQKIRGDIVKYREYTHALTKISGSLGEDVIATIKRQEKRKAVVLISSDRGFFGNAFDILGEHFQKSLDKADDIFIVGSIGEEMVKDNMLKIKYRKVASDEESLAKLWQELGRYQEMYIYYLRYESLAKQSVDIKHISGDLLPKEGEKYDYDGTKKTKYFYEPTVAEVVELFAHEILSFIAEQTMKESDLAKYAAKLMYLDSCIERNDENLKTVMRQRTKIFKRLSNKRQNSRMVNYLIRNG